MIPMRSLHLDYQRSFKSFPWLGFGLLAAALAAIVSMAGYYHQLGQRIVELEARVDRGERLSDHRTRPLLPVTRQAAQEQTLEVEHANQVLRQLTLPWDKLFQAVESSGGKSVAMLSMEPDVEKGMVRISGEAKNFDAVLDYVRQLGSRDEFGSVHLQNHQVLHDDPEKPVHFSLLAVWKAGAS
jgi:hypothetical protein